MRSAVFLAVGKGIRENIQEGKTDAGMQKRTEKRDVRRNMETVPESQKRKPRIELFCRCPYRFGAKSPAILHDRRTGSESLLRTPEKPEEMKYLFVLIFVLIYSFFDKSIGYTNTSPVWTHFTYMFQHANPVHLIINSLAFIGIFGEVSKYEKKRFVVFGATAIAFFGSFLPSAMFEIPTAGASGMIYAMIGMFTAVVLFDKRLKINVRKFSIFLCSVLICLSVSYFRENSNFFLHLFCLAAGFFVRSVLNK
jgi:membrane associated rhomboid family serine protease